MKEGREKELQNFQIVILNNDWHYFNIQFSVVFKYLQPCMCEYKCFNFYDDKKLYTDKSSKYKVRLKCSTLSLFMGEKFHKSTINL